jgi:hypothetical protein
VAPPSFCGAVAATSPSFFCATPPLNASASSPSAMTTEVMTFIGGHETWSRSQEEAFFSALGDDEKYCLRYGEYGKLMNYANS